MTPQDDDDLAEFAALVVQAFKQILVRLDAAEAWIEQHKKEAAAFKAQSQQPTQLIDRELFKPTTIQAPLPMENGPNVVHYRKWSELQHKVVTVSEPDLGGEA